MHCAVCWPVTLTCDLEPKVPRRAVCLQAENMLVCFSPDLCFVFPGLMHNQLDENDSGGEF